MTTQINKKSVANLKIWFDNYVNHFKYDNAELQKNIVLKIDHTFRVCMEILNIGKLLGLNQHELFLAEVIALLHDIGRFEQYAKYKTFLDRKSTNHAELGVSVLEKEDVLFEFSEPVRDLIKRAVLYHNRAMLPENESDTCLFFTKLLRDADKLDIWRVVTNYYHHNNGQRNGAIELDLPDSPGFSEAVYHDLMNKNIVDIKHVNNLNDFKLLQIGWVFDVNFRPTLQYIEERCYLELIRDVLPNLHEIEKMFDVVHDHLHYQLSH